MRNVEDAKQCASKLLAHGIRRVIITLGANGSLLASQAGSASRPRLCSQQRRQQWRGRRIHRKLRRISCRRLTREQNPSAARIFMRLCPRPASELRNLFLTVRASTPNGVPILESTNILNSVMFSPPMRDSCRTFQCSCFPNAAIRKNDRNLPLTRRKFLT